VITEANSHTRQAHNAVKTILCSNKIRYENCPNTTLLADWFIGYAKKSNYCTNLTFGGILNRHGHFKHTLRAQRYRDCGR
jgi:hypothetical protein